VSNRSRVVALVAVAAAAAAGATVGVTLATRSHVPRLVTLKPRPGAPPLYLDLGVRTDAAARAIRNATTLYGRGRHAEALQIFDRYRDLDAQVGAALAAWPTGTIDRLQALASAHPRSAVVRLNLGIAQYWAGHGPQALAAWRSAVAVDPDSASAVSADGFLHPDFAPSLPPFVPSFPAPAGLSTLPPDRQLEALARRARTGGAHAKLLYGAALQRLGRPISAERQFAAAARLAPDDPDAQVAAAVGLFSKAHPERAFGKLGPLARRFPTSPSVRFHLGVMLLWMRQLKQARAELRKAVADGPRTTPGIEAKRFLEGLASVRTS
jgi:tetratricopeptide (TPR) repeat protein